MQKEYIEEKPSLDDFVELFNLLDDVKGELRGLYEGFDVVQSASDVLNVISNLKSKAESVLTTNEV